MGFREDATTVELQTWYVFSLVKAEFPAHLTLTKNEACISIHYKNANLLILYREQAKNPIFQNTKQARWPFSKKFMKSENTFTCHCRTKILYNSLLNLYICKSISYNWNSQLGSKDLLKWPGLLADWTLVSLALFTQFDSWCRTQEACLHPPLVEEPLQTLQQPSPATGPAQLCISLCRIIPEQKWVTLEKTHTYLYCRDCAHSVLWKCWENTTLQRAGLSRG